MYEKEYTRRWNEENAIHIDINIGSNPAFVYPDYRMYEKIVAILRVDTNIRMLCVNLPGIAIHHYTERCLIGEILQSNNIEGFSVDMYGSAALVNDEGVTAQIAFGMDHNYKCELEVWGSKGTIYTNRILTAPAGFVPEVIIRKGNEEEKRNLPADDAFKKSILHFCECIEEEEVRKENYQTLLRQARLVEDFKNLAGLDS